jgi:hypothetical protein
MKRKPFYASLCCALLCSGLLALASCQKEDNGPAAGSAATLHVYLTDSPGDYQAVWIDIEKAQILVVTGSGATQTGTWMDAPLKHPGRYNLLDYRNGEDTLLASVPVPAGTLQQIKLTLGKSNTLVLSNGTTVQLVAPGEVKTDATLVVTDTGKAKTYGLIMDFDVERSIVNGTVGDSGNYMFSPYVRAFPKGSGAVLEGWVAPPSVETQVVAYSFADTVETLTDDQGYYRLRGLMGSSYILDFYPDPASGYQMTGEGPVAAVAGQVVTTDTVHLSQ